MVTDRFERKWLLVVFGAIIALSGLFYGLTFNPIMIVAFGFLVNFFERGYTAVAYAYSPEVFDTRTRSLGTSFSYGLGRLSNAIGPLIIAALYTGAGYQDVFFFIAGTWLFGAIILALFGASTRKARLAHARHPAADGTAGRVIAPRPACGPGRDRQRPSPRSGLPRSRREILTDNDSDESTRASSSRRSDLGRNPFAVQTHHRCAPSAPPALRSHQVRTPAPQPMAPIHQENR